MQNKVKKRREHHALKRERVLEYLKKVGETGAETLINVLLAIPEVSGAMLASSKRGAIRNLHALSPSWRVDFKSRRSVYDVIARLERAGLIENRSGHLKILRRGLAYLSRLAKRPSWTKKYRTKRSNGINLIVFDIPEKKRIARDWLRVKLKEFGYKPIQQSVWLGKNGVSFEFISDLRNYEILDCIHILKICNKGSIGALLP